VKKIVRVFTAAFAAALLVLAGGSAGRATTSGPPYRLYQAGLAWSPQGYTFQYTSSRAQATLHPYVDAIRAQLHAVTGVQFAASTTISGASADPRIIFVALEYRPCSSAGDFVGAGAGAADESCGGPVVDGSTLSWGSLYLDAEYWNADGSLAAGYSAGQTANVVSHEVGHALGLGHPNASGITSTAGDCVVGNDGGELPVMCSGSASGHGVGGYQDDRAGEFVQQFDVQGFRQLAAAGGAALPTQGAIKGIAAKCLDVDTPGNVDVQNGRRVQIWDCNGMPQQQWIAAADGTLRVLGRCLDDYAAGSADGNPLVLWTCNGTAWQGWHRDADGTVINTDPAVGKYLDDKYAGTNNGNPVWLYEHTGTAAQIWSAPGGTMPPKKR
jgi:hypothetical protein